MVKKLSVVAVVLFLLPQFADAQYFGRNKVQYENFHFKKMTSSHFNVYFYPEEENPVRDATNMLERWYERQQEVMKDTLIGKQPVILYANHPDFQQTNVISGMISQGTGGVTEGQMNRMVIPLTGVNQDNNHVLGHELVHAFQYTIIKNSEQGLRASRNMPLWFIEGMAEYLSIGRSDPLTAMWMRDAVLHDDVPSIKTIARNPEYFPYRYGHALWAFITGISDDSVIRALLSQLMETSWKESVEKVLDYEPDSLSNEWQQTIKENFGPQLDGRTKPDSLGTRIISGEKGMNLSPVISPDGKYIAFLSQRDLFTIDLYLADAQTGEIIRKLISSNTDSHFDALRFINSAGAWSPDGKSFAFIVIENGDDNIAILDVEKQKVRRTIKLPDVNAITHLAWSPDGTRLVASGISKGVSDLFLYDLKSGDMERLTDDKYSDLQPDWSPDGSTIVFASDRGESTNFETFEYSAMQLSFLHLNTGEISVASLGEQFKHINPQYSPDGQDVYLISDPDGVSDIYRYSITQHQFYRVTKVATGVSGLTELSPALSVAKNSNQMVFTVFNKMNYDVNRLPIEPNQGDAFTANIEDYEINTALPPRNEDINGLVATYMNNYTLGLPMTQDFPVSKYNPGLKLLAIGQVGVGIAVNRYGSGIGGGVNMLFSDLLGNNLLGVSLQANGGIKDIGGEAMYVNRDHRWNWGAVIGHIPYRTRRASPQFYSAGRDSIIQILLEQRVFEDQIQPMAEYPLSQNRRMEFSVGYDRISYDVQADTFYTDLRTGYTTRKSGSLPAPDPINLFQVSAAYVGDYSFFGYTSPVRGKRYRFELQPSFGTLRFLTVTADYRKYFFFRPFTLAFRLLHYGRYLKDSENNRMSPLQLGYPTLVRGYDPGTFSASECTGQDCPEFNRLIGSKIGVFNAEFRIPLLGSEQFGILNFPYLPTELLTFFDGGVAWTNDSQPVWKWATESTKRIPVFSTGVAARVNLFGYIVGQVFYVYPFQRPEHGAYFGFAISPGW